MTIIQATFEFEEVLWNKGWKFIAGVDEVGVGCLAGPVVAAAVILKPETEIDLLRDSKKLSESQREKTAEKIKIQSLAWAIGSASVDEITEFNIRGADFLAMKRALAQLNITPDAVLSDGFQIPKLAIYNEAITKGDQKSKTIAAASIIAKVFRDTLMREYETQFPGYGFAKHKGYGTKIHCDALSKLGPCPIHRTTFAPIRESMVAH
jgi:ribonuclease HII